VRTRYATTTVTIAIPNQVMPNAVGASRWGRSSVAYAPDQRPASHPDRSSRITKAFSPFPPTIAACHRLSTTYARPPARTATIAGAEARTRRVAAATAIPPTPSATANNAPSLRSMTAATTPSTIGGQQRIATDPSNHRIADHTARAAPAAPSECAITQ
jgi:hypothetical protein